MVARVPGQLCGYRKYRPQYLDGRNWLHRNSDPAEPLRFVAVKGDLTLTPPEAFEHDFATIPRWVWAAIGAPTGDGAGAAYGPAAVIHDWAYEHQHWDGGEPLSRAEADRILWECCLDLDVDEWRADLMYTAVRIGGGAYWRKHEHEKIHPSYGGEL